MKLSSSEHSPATPIGSLSSRIEINAIKTAILQEINDGESKLLDESTSTPETSSDLSLEEMHDDSLTNLMVNSIDMDNNIVGTNISLTGDFQMSDPKLKWLKTIIETKGLSPEGLKINKKDLKNNIQKKLLKYLPR